MEEEVDEYWIVDLDARVVELWRKGENRPEILTDSVSWRPHARVEALEIDLGAYFAIVLSD